MHDDAIDVACLDVTGLPDDDVAMLGDTALGFAVRRRLVATDAGPDSAEGDPIAVHDSHV